MSLSKPMDKDISTITKNAMLSSDDTKNKYINDARYINHQKDQYDKKERIKTWIKKQRELRKDVPETEFIRDIIFEYNIKVLRTMIDDFRNIIPPTEMQKLTGLTDKENIEVVNDPSVPDIYSNKDTGKMTFNLAKVDTERGQTLEDMIVSLLGRFIHEALKLVVNFDKQNKLKDAVVNYTLTSGRKITSPKKETIKMLEQGFIEKIASEFAEKHGFYYTMNPSNIPLADIWSYLEQNYGLGKEDGFNSDYSEIVGNKPDASHINSALDTSYLLRSGDPAVEAISPDDIDAIVSIEEEAATMDLTNDDESIVAPEVDPELKTENSDTLEEISPDEIPDEVKDQENPLDQPIKEPAPEEVTKIEQENQEKSLAEDGDLIKKPGDKVLVYKPKTKTDDDKDNEGFISILSLISIIVAFSSSIITFLIYILSK